MTPQTKSARIMTLHKQGKTTREIAVAVFATQTPTRANLAYVRVVKGQRKESGVSPADRRYMAKVVETNPPWYVARQARWSAHGNRWHRTSAGRAYRSRWERNKRLEARSANQIG